MKPQFIYNSTRDYITHVFIHGERIIPSDTFEINNNEYLLLGILKSTDNILFLKILCIEGLDMGSQYIIPKNLFENSTLGEIKNSLSDYKH